MEIIEIYILCKERSKKLVLEFLDKLLPNRDTSAEDYPYPEYDDEPEHVYDDIYDLMVVLDDNKNESYSLYWGATDSAEVKNAMVFYTADGGLIAGIAVEDGDREAWLKRLSKLVGGKFGYVSFDSPPPETTQDFIAYCESSDQIRLVAGNVIQG
ncbi:hypothetical protein [Rheinheimera hassiensis]|uniref:hypothetical protein n=1 Tax=Rheinheimera hassiensis TaxID=1193627 RepID=UPI001F05E88A|nr:hypothetical protein [Rheinheimera hassiensis]